MPLQKLQFRPGVNRESTSLANEGGWFDCNKIRFRSGYPEKIGGWAVDTYITFLGTCRSLWNWVTLKNFNLLGVGTSLKFYVENGGDYYDITPIRETNGNTVGPGVNLSLITLSITNTSNVLTISDTAAEALQVGDFIKLAGAVALGSTGTNVTAAVLNQEYQIAAILSSTSYRVYLRSASTSINGVNFTINPQTSTLNFPIGTSLSNGQTVVLLPTEVLPVGLATDTIYYVVNAVVNASEVKCQLSATLSGAPRSITTTGVGQQAVYFTLASNRTASSSTMTNLTIAYQINTGANIFTLGTGWGAGPWSRGTWGSAYTLDPVVGLQLRLWSQANFGEILLFNPRGSALYAWDPLSGATPAFSTRGVLVSGPDVPSQINQIMVSDISRITIAFGCSDYGVYGTAAFDPLLIRWTAQESYTNWTPAITNQAGDSRLSHGSTIVGAIQTRQEILVWTDSAIYSMQYLGPPLVYGFTLLADNLSIVSPNAMATAAGVVYWMGVDKFYMYSGRVETLPCSVRQFVFNDINRNQQDQFFAGTNEGYSEVWWFYCSKNSNTIDRYVIFNYLDRVWYYGTMGRTAWSDTALREYPIAATNNNLIVYHEAAVDNGETNPPTAINAYIQSSDFDIEDGHNYGFVWRIIPDITFDGSDTRGTTSVKPYVQFTVRPKQNPGSGYGTALSPTVQSAQSYAGQTTYNVQQFTEIIYSRVRGRQMAFKIESNSVGTQWQLGMPRIDVRPDGRN